MTVIRPARRFAPALAAAALISLGTGVSHSQAATVSAVPKDAAVSSTGHVITPQQAAAMVPAALRGGSSSHPGAKAGPAPGVRPNSIIGTDNRGQVANTSSYPYSSVVLVTRPGYSVWCTGWMISRDTLLTAGHCVYSGGSGGTWYSGLQFKPGSNGGNAPFGTCTPRTTYALNGWINSADWAYDAGIVKLNCTVGNSTGWFGMYWQTAALDGTYTTVSGYPGDKPATQWVSYDSVRASETEHLYYDNDTVGGQSGSPVWSYRTSGGCTGYCGLAVHAYGVGGSGNAASHNSGTRITQAKYTTFIGIANAA